MLCFILSDYSLLRKKPKIPIMVAHKLVEVGRVVQIKRGPLKNKSAIIVDIVDQNTILVQNPEQNVSRQVVNLKSIALTDIVAKINRAASSSSIRKAFKEQGINQKYQGTANARKSNLASVFSNSTDFERFQLQRARRIRRAIVKKAGKSKQIAEKPKAKK